ncbi:phosphate:Na+ symporter [Malonomonas rubra DSM 5091]|uniref:Phosphate:Na+ symporter n=1 Tax=Malonomonas rubra DSM 5091 TaxID=1122189 RepID=A0A1M6DYI5_MALRU|nr:Na/Pi cotransporter family protein [Malonomonas rubra]SHI78324.1 phosphate:Na+ symporter [Malonomonas rubra DSM 5091]
MRIILPARVSPLLFCLAAVLLLPLFAWAVPVGSPSMAWGEMGMGVFGGLALFLLGMEQMTDALKAAAGARMQKILGHLTANRFKGAFVGAMVTAVIQSSSVTTVLLVGFVSAGLMTLSQSVGVIMGANIGSTITAQIVAFKVTKLALGFIAVGFTLLFLARQDKFKQYGGVLLGLGLVFFGMNVMSESMYSLRSYQPFLDLMVRMETPLLGILVGCLFTALVQSSAATTGIVIVMASQGFVTLPAGIAMALGANIGTCFTACLASLGKPRPALRAAAVHVVFNVLGVLIWVAFIDQLAEWTRSISPAWEHFNGVARLAAETPRQIANANTLFNVANTLLFIGFTPWLAKLVTWALPDKECLDERVIIKPKFLDDDLLDTPSMALSLVRMEIGHLGRQVQLMLVQSRLGLEERNEQIFAEVEKADDAADILHSEIVAYLSRVGKRELSKEQAEEFYQLSQIADNLESIGDVLESDLSVLGRKMIKQQMQPSETMLMILSTLHEWIYRALEAAVKAAVEKDQVAAQEVVAMRSEINQQIEAALQRQVSSLAQSSAERLATLQMEFELIDKLKRIYTLTKRISRIVLPKDV